MNFETMSCETSQKNERREDSRDLWGRVSEKAFEILTTEGNLRDNPEILKKIKNLLGDEKFISEVKKIWDNQILGEKRYSDPEEQEENWARGLVLRIKEKIKNG